MFTIVRSVDTRRVQGLFAAIWLPGGVSREPVRMGLQDFAARAVGVHSREHDDPVLARGLQNVPEEIAIAKKLRAAMKRHLCRVVGDDATRVDDDPLGAGALPLFSPEGDVVPRRVDLRDVRLHPAEGAAIPRLSLGGGGLGDGRSRVRRHAQPGRADQRRRRRTQKLPPMHGDGLVFHRFGQNGDRSCQASRAFDEGDVARMVVAERQAPSLETPSGLSPNRPDLWKTDPSLYLNIFANAVTSRSRSASLNRAGGCSMA